MRRLVGVGRVLAVLLGAAVGLAACAPFGDSTSIATPTVARTSAPSTIGPATMLPATMAATAPSAAALPTVIAPATAPPPTTASTSVPPIPSTTLPPPSTVVLSPAASLTPTGVSGPTATDKEGRCAITLPAGFAAAGGGGVYSGADGRVTVTLTALPAQAGDTLDDVALPFVSTFTAEIGDYQQTRVARGADSLRLDYTGRTTAPGQGTIALRQFGGMVCALSFFAAQGSRIHYEQIVEQLIASLRPVGSVGWRRETTW